MLWQVSDFLMRVKSRRFPTIEKDMKMVLAHCGSLYLDPASLMQVSCIAHAQSSCIYLHTPSQLQCSLCTMLIEYSPVMHGIRQGLVAC